MKADNHKPDNTQLLTNTPLNLAGPTGNAAQSTPTYGFTLAAILGGAGRANLVKAAATAQWHSQRRQAELDRLSRLTESRRRWEAQKQAALAADKAAAQKRWEARGRN